MKNLIVFFLSLTCLAAHAQYNQNRSSKPSLFSSYMTNKLNKSNGSPLMKFQVQRLHQTSTTQTQGYTQYSNTGAGPVNATQQGYWSGSRMTTSGMNGRFQAIQSFDMNGNLRESKATYQFPTRRKR